MKEAISLVTPGDHRYSGQTESGSDVCRPPCEGRSLLGDEVVASPPNRWEVDGWCGGCCVGEKRYPLEPPEQSCPWGSELAWQEPSDHWAASRPPSPSAHYHPSYDRFGDRWEVVDGGDDGEEDC